MTTLEQAARMALEKMEYMVAHGEWYEPEQAISALRQALEQQQKCEPVAWLTEAAWGKDVSLEKPNFGNTKWKAPEPKVTALYAIPPDTEWVGLTEDEIAQVANTAETYTESVKLTEAALKEKNT